MMDRVTNHGRSYLDGYQKGRGRGRNILLVGNSCNYGLPLPLGGVVDPQSDV